MIESFNPDNESTREVNVELNDDTVAYDSNISELKLEFVKDAGKRQKFGSIFRILIKFNFFFLRILQLYIQ